MRMHFINPHLTLTLNAVCRRCGGYVRRSHLMLTGVMIAVLPVVWCGAGVVEAT